MHSSKRLVVKCSHCARYDVYEWEESSDSRRLHFIRGGERVDYYNGSVLYHGAADRIFKEQWK